MLHPPQTHVRCASTLADGGIFFIAGIQIRTTSCRKRKHSTQCADPYRESLHYSDPLAATWALERGAGGLSPRARVELLLMRCFPRVGTGSSDTTSQTPSPIACTTPLVTTYTAYSPPQRSAGMLLLCPSRQGARLRDTAGCVSVEKTKAILLLSSLTEVLAQTRWMSDWISVERGRVEAPWAEAAVQDEARP